jgi:hypothetical protein
MLDDDLKKKIIDEIVKSGFPLELEIIEKLRNHDCLTFPNISFQDSKGFTHEIDVLSILGDTTNMWQYGPTGVHLIAECKKTDKHQWVFFDEGFNPLSGGVASKIDYSTDFAVLNQKVFNPLDNLYSTRLASHHFENPAIRKVRTYVETFKKPNEPTSIYKAVSNIFFARKFLKDWFSSTRSQTDESGRTFLNHFVIVLDGPLLLAHKDRDTFNLEEVSHLLLLTFDSQENIHSGLLDNEIVIDVIRKDYFSDYIQLVKKDARCFNEHLNRIWK